MIQSGLDIGVSELLVLGVWPLLSLIGLIGLRRTSLTRTIQALWALLILAVPIMGALAFFIVRPGGINRA